MDIIERAYNNVIYECPIDDEEKGNIDKIYKNIEKIQNIIDENRKYLASEKEEFDELINNDNISSDNYMIFILTINTFNEFADNLEKCIHTFINGKRINNFTKKTMDNIKMYLNELSSLNNRNAIAKNCAEFDFNNNYISIEPIIGRLTQFAAKIQEEIIHCNVYDEKNPGELILKPDLDKRSDCKK